MWGSWDSRPQLQFECALPFKIEAELDLCHLLGQLIPRLHLDHLRLHVIMSDLSLYVQGCVLEVFSPMTLESFPTTVSPG